MDTGAQVDVQLDCGGTMLLARITRLSRERLGIEPGMRVWAIVKSVGVDRTAGTAATRRDRTKPIEPDQMLIS